MRQRLRALIKWLNRYRPPIGKTGEKLLMREGGLFQTGPKHQKMMTMRSDQSRWESTNKARVKPTRIHDQ